MPFGPTHTIIRLLARSAVDAFFQDVTVLDGDDVPKTHPLLVLANHHSMTVDPAVLSSYFPHNRNWAKDGLFKHPLARRILLDAGNIPVDRKTKNNALLYAGTFDAFKRGECVAVFPEGTSMDVPGLMPLKDGASFTALEYLKDLKENPSKSSLEVKIAVVGITYVDKTKYRSSIIIQHASSIDVRPFFEEFLVDPKTAAKKLTHAIHEALISVTINANSWDGMHAARMARELLWPEQSRIPREEFRNVSQRLVDIFEGEDDQNPSRDSLRDQLVQLRKLLQKTSLSSTSLGRRSLPRKLDPDTKVELPRRINTLWNLFKDTIVCLTQLPFFLVPMLFHLPMYIAAKMTMTLLNSDDVESFAQNKIVFGLLFCFFSYPFLFVILWLLFFTTPLGAVVAFGLVWLFAIYHNRMIDSNYKSAKKLLATWRILIAVWLPIGEAGQRIRKTLRLRQEAALSLAKYLNSHGHGEYFARYNARVGKAEAFYASEFSENTSAPPSPTISFQMRHNGQL